MAHGLAAAGIGPGDVVSCQLPNCNEWIILALATIELGAVLNPIPPTYRANELRFILNALEARALVVPARFRNHDHAAMAVELRADTPSLRDVFVVRGSPGEGMRSFTWLTANKSVATVNKGKVIAIAPGLARITATTDGGMSATASITVIPKP